MADNPPLRALEIFVQLARFQSLTDAAQHLHMSQSGVSRTLAALESSVKAKLLVRGNRGFSLTADGKAFLAMAKRILADVNQAWAGWADYAQGQAGRLNVAVLPSIASVVMPRAVASFTDSHPNVELTITDHLAADLEAYANEASVDLLLTYLPGASQLGHERKPGFLEYPLLYESFVAVVARRHPLLERESVTLADVCEFPLSMCDPKTSIGITVDAILVSSGLSYSTYARLSSITSLEGFIAAGMSVSIVPALLTAVMPASRIEVVPIADVAQQRCLGILLPTESQPSAVARHFMVCLQETIAGLDESLVYAHASTSPSLA